MAQRKMNFYSEQETTELERIRGLSSADKKIAVKQFAEKFNRTPAGVSAKLYEKPKVKPAKYKVIDIKHVSKDDRGVLIFDIDEIAVRGSKMHIFFR